MKVFTKSLTLVLVLAALASTAFAGDAWLRFDNDLGASAGGMIYPGTTFSDENANHDGFLAYESMGMSYTWSNDVPNSQVYDPLTDTTYTNSLSFYGGEGENFYDYFISLNNSMSLPMVTSANSFTIEMFFKTQTTFGHSFEFVNENAADKRGVYAGINNRDLTVKVTNDIGGVSYTQASYAHPDWYPGNNEWHHYAVTWDGTDMKTYLDYAEQVSMTNLGSWTITDSQSAFNVASFYSDAKTADSLDGSIDEFRITGQALAPEQFLQCEGIAAPENPQGGTNYGLIAYYDFEEGSGTTLTDLSGNEKDGTWVNGSGQSNYSTDVPSTLSSSTQAGSFGRIDAKNGDHVDLPFLQLAENSRADGVTVSLWVKKEGTDKHWVVSETSSVNGMPIYNLGMDCQTPGYSSFMVRSDTNSMLLHSDGMSSTQQTSDAANPEWHHIAWTDHNGEMKIYIDGVLDSTDFTYSPSSSLTCDVTTLGAWMRNPSTPDYHFDGLMDDFAAWDLLLTDAQIAALATGASPLTILSPQVAGDANNDGKVDGSDVTILAGNWQKGVSDGLTATWAEGDFNGDGKVDGSDVTILAGNWQYGVEAAAASVPEPSVIVLLLGAIGTLLVVRRK